MNAEDKAEPGSMAYLYACIQQRNLARNILDKKIELEKLNQIGI
jgi:hypothetical protein